MLKNISLLLIFTIPFSVSLFAQVAGKPSLEPIDEGSTEIKGSLFNGPPMAKVTVLRARAGSADTPFSTTLTNDGVFSAKLPAPARAGDKFTATETVGNKSSDPVVVLAQTPRFLIVPMYEGDLNIIGRVEHFGQNTQFYILRNSGRETVSLDSEGKFTASLTTTALIAKEQIRFLLESGSTADDDVLVVRERIATPGQEGDLGFGRYYFTGGTIISKRNDFQGADIYAAFNFDKSWLIHTPNPNKKVSTKRKEAENKPKRTFQHFYFNSYFDARLTSIPIAQGSGDQLSNSGQSAASGSGSASSSTSTESLVAQSKKAALLQVGAYIPIIVAEKRVGGEPNALFIAPIAKAGLQTVTGSNTTSEGASLGGDDLYNFHGFGARVGQFRQTATSSTPQTVWYLDAVLGHYENFELCETTFTDDKGSSQIARGVCPQTLTDGSNGTLPMRRYRPLRTSVEGRLKVPGLPLFVGFDVNAGKGPDDVRFLFGTRFDIGELARRIH